MDDDQRAVEMLLQNGHGDRAVLQGRLADCAASLAHAEENRARWERCAKSLYGFAARDVMDLIAGSTANSS